jgi:hypothetical protein
VSEPRREDDPVLVFLLLGFSPPLLFLTVVELRELRPNYGWWIWWLLLVFMTHFLGYLVLRVYAAIANRRAAQA